MYILINRGYSDQRPGMLKRSVSENLQGEEQWACKRMSEQGIILPLDFDYNTIFQK